MKFSNALAVALFGAVAAQGANAATFNLSLNADDGSRWYNYFSDVYAELGSDWGVIENEASAEFGEMADGFYLIGSGTKVGSGAIVFPNLNNFLSVGSITYNETTGAITGLSANFSAYIADNDGEVYGFTGGNPYVTSFGSVTGNVSLTGGAVSGVSLSAPITFTYFTGLGALAFNGTFAIDGDIFSLNVDGTNPTPFGAVRYQWDVTGSVQNLAPVPEPTTWAMMGAGLLAVAGMARRRRV